MTIAMGVAIRIASSISLEVPFKSRIDIEKENDHYD
jgi:hypothetical protein